MASDLVKKRLDREDLVQESYLGRLEGNYGTLVLSKRKLWFVEEKGFLRKTYNLALEIPYEKADRVTVEGRDKLVITEVGGGKHIFTFEELSASLIEKSLKEIMESGLSKAKA